MEKQVRKNFFGEGYTVTDEGGNEERFEKNLLNDNFTSDKGTHVDHVSIYRFQERN